MRVPADLIGLAGHALFWAAMLSLLLRRFSRVTALLARLPWLVWLLPVLVGVSGLAWVMRGVFSDLSLTGIGVAACLLVRGKIKLPTWLLTCWVLFGFALYLSALGLADWDLYSIGYDPQVLLVMVLFWVILNGLTHTVLGWSLAIAMALYAGRWLDSINLWDHLLDPLTWLIFSVMFVRQGREWWRNRKNKANKIKPELAEYPVE